MATTYGYTGLALGTEAIQCFNTSMPLDSISAVAAQIFCPQSCTSILKLVLQYRNGFTNNSWEGSGSLSINGYG